MTSPGGGEIIVSPDDNYDHVATRRNQAADFFTDKPPDIPDEPDDPTKGATRDLTGAVQGTGHGLGHHSNDVADGVERATDNYVNSDQNNAGLLGAVGAGGAQKEAAKGLTDVGVGSIMNSFLNPTGAITGAFEQSLGGFSQAAGGLSQGAGNIVGQMGNAAIQVGAKAASAAASAGGGAASAAGGAAGLGGTVGAGAHLVGDSKAAGGPEEPQTRPVSGVMPPSAAPSATAGRGSDYVHTELQDRNDTTAHPAGMAMGGVPAGAGLVGGGGGSHGSAATAPTYRITTGNDAHDPATGPTPAVIDPGIAAAPASVSLPLLKDT